MDMGPLNTISPKTNKNGPPAFRNHGNSHKTDDLLFLEERLLCLDQRGARELFTRVSEDHETVSLQDVTAALNEVLVSPE